MKILKGAVLVCALALISSQGLAQSTGDDWKLVAYNFASNNNYNIDDKDVTVTLDTREQRIAGNSGCNRFMGPFKFEDSGRLAVGPFAGTLMACPRIDNRFETAFRTTLGNIDSFAFETGYLTNAVDLGYIHSPEGQKQIALGMRRAIEVHFARRLVDTAQR